MDPAVVVVGSLNVDLVVRVGRHPHPGETVLGGDVARYAGGKGANQAVAAARLGQPVAMVGRVGDDDAGATLVRALEADGVEASTVAVTSGVPTGTALIVVDVGGENTIVVSPGANARVTADDVRASAERLEAAAVVLLQLEIPMETVEEAARLAGGTLVLNPAPAAALDAELLRRVDVLVPNRSELAALTGRPVASDVAAAASSLRGPAAVVVTLGSEGAVVASGDRSVVVPAPPVEVVDTTAAGDAFCGGLADAIVRGADVVEAARWAVRVAAAAVARPGAQSSLPTRAEVR
ncbi:MAG TPA: ribokinase [Actinomycetota bacterium]|nr:ribokinase [Actinomycetota bacterium]